MLQEGPHLQPHRRVMLVLVPVPYHNYMTSFMVLQVPVLRTFVSTNYFQHVY